ncbi:MAG: hypothetical protein KAY37_16020 [Phycisphaerae bacterium]|nr:hypothetical protein [Phycisphaerae bacterium]
MPPATDVSQHVEALISEVERVVRQHCNPDNKVGFLDAEQRNAAYRRVGCLSQGVFDCLRPRIGDAAAQDLRGAVLSRVKRLLNWADAESYGDPNIVERHKARRLAALRREYETTDLPLVFTSLRNSIDGAVRDSHVSKDSIPCAWLRSIVPQRVVKGASDKVALYLKRRDVHIFKVGGRNHCERKDALRVFQRHRRIREFIEEYGKDTD